jgi:hypothetical protein
MDLEKLASEAAEEYFGYRVIYDINEFTNGFDMAAGMPPKYFELLFSGEAGAKLAMEMQELIEPACRNIIEMLKIHFTGDVWAHYGPFLESIVKSILATRNSEGQQLLGPYVNELYEFALWGVLLGLSDSERIGEKPPVALGAPFEAQKYVLDADVESADPVDELVRSTKLMCVRHGFFALRAGYVPIP